MPTSNKTPNLNLNNWLGTDKPKREDFVGDNLILDNVINTHLTNVSMHLTTADRAKLNAAPFLLITLDGTGSATKAHTLTIAPTFVFVFLPDYPMNSYDPATSRVMCSSGIAYTDFYGSTPGISLNGKVLTLSQSQSSSSSGLFLNLNKSGEQYLCIAFK